MPDEIKVFILRQMQWAKPTYNTYTPGEWGDESSRWKNLVSVEDFRDAEYLIVFNTPTVDLMRFFPPEKILYFKGEPDEFDFSKHMFDNVNPASHVYKRPINHWHSKKSYSWYKSHSFPEKSKDLSWVTTNAGDGSAREQGTQVLPCQRLRMQFLVYFLKKYPNKLHLFGRGLNSYIPAQDFGYNHGQLSNKWDGLKDFRYTFAFETSVQAGYFTGKLIDAVLAGCMPIYYGCPDLEDFIPKNSFIRLDIAQDDAPDGVMDIIKSDFREQHLEELKRAKELLLDKWNIWNIFCEEVNKVHQNLAALSSQSLSK